MNKILVPTDFSTCANNAVNFAVQTAKYLSVKVTLLHSFEQSDNMYTNYVGLDKEYTRLLLHDVNEKMDQLAKSIKDTEGIEVDTLISGASLEDAITTVSAEKGIDLVVMGTLGATGLREMFWGSKTASLIDKTTVPLMVIPYEYAWKKPVNFLLTTNHFEDDPAILNYLFEMIKLYSGKLEVVTFSDEDYDESHTRNERAGKLRDYEVKLKETYGDDALTTTKLHGTEFEETLQEHIKKNDIDILAMVTYHQSKNFFYRLFNSSITKRMSYHTEIPLLVIPGEVK